MSSVSILFSLIETVSPLPVTFGQSRWALLTLLAERSKPVNSLSVKGFRASAIKIILVSVNALLIHAPDACSKSARTDWSTFVIGTSGYWFLNWLISETDNNKDICLTDPL